MSGKLAVYIQKWHPQTHLSSSNQKYKLLSQFPNYINQSLTLPNHQNWTRERERESSKNLKLNHQWRLLWEGCWREAPSCLFAVERGCTPLALWQSLLHLFRGSGIYPRISPVPTSRKKFPRFYSYLFFSFPRERERERLMLQDSFLAAFWVIFVKKTKWKGNGNTIYTSCIWDENVRNKRAEFMVDFLSSWFDKGIR